MIPQDIKDFCNQVSKATGIAARVIWAQMIAENGLQRGAIDVDNNPLNIRYTGNLRPQETGWVYLKNVTGVKENGVVVYPTLQDGIDATIAVLSEHYYDNVRAVAIANPTDYEAQAKAMQDSPWDFDHYFQSATDPGHIIDELRVMGETDFSDAPVNVDDKPSPGGGVEPDSNEQKAKAAEIVSKAYAELWNKLDNATSRDFIHYQLMLLRVYLCSHGIGTIGADGRLYYTGITGASYNI